ncbi:MAG: hypothetical protein ACI4S3_10460 [Candidatus Gastranaerophilaceae bacterium]
MKRFTLGLLFLLFLGLPSNAYNMVHFTNDFKISDALVLLEQNGATEIFDNLQENSVKILFYDLSMLSYSYRDHYAINGENSMGQRFILINTKYMKCSVEEIACLIAHESCHKAKVATLAEETLATQTEAKYWIKLKQANKIYKENDLYDRLNNLAYLYKNSTKAENKIQEKIANSEFYKAQLSVK